MAIQLDIVDSIGSTNSELVARLARGEAVPEAYWLVANRQGEGRGRQGRKWIDGEGNFMGSCAVHLDEGQPPAASLSFLAALAVYETSLSRIADPARLQIKWPNDILLDGAKFCGILLEREGDFAVIGIGVNLSAAPKLDDRKTATLSGNGGSPDRDLFARDLAAQFDRELERWRQFGTEPLFRRWQAAAHKPGTRLVVHGDQGEKLAGTFEGLAEDGALRLRLQDGSLRAIHAGDVTLEAQ